MRLSALVQTAWVLTGVVLRPGKAAGLARARDDCLAQRRGLRVEPVVSAQHLEDVLAELDQGWERE